MDYFDSSKFGTGAAQRFQSQSPWGSGETGNPLVQGVTQGTDLFLQHFRSLMGRDPTADELGQYQVNALAGALPNAQNPGYAALSGLSDSYINNQFGNEIAASQQAKQQKAQNDSLDATQNRAQNLVKSLNQSTSDYLTSPEAQASIQGKLNNSGILNSGAYSQTLAGLMAQGASQNQANVLQGVTVPALNNIQGLSSMSGLPYSQSQQNGQYATGRLDSLSDFNMQATLAKMLAGMGQPSGAQSILGMASSGAQGVGSLAQGAGALKSSGATPSYVCREMLKRGLLCESDLEDFYAHLFPSIAYKARAFWHYVKFGQQLVDEANTLIPGWAELMKPMIFDRVMQEKDPLKAVDIYANGLKSLCDLVNPSLWDKRVMRTGIVDSIPFIPLLFLCRPFRLNFWRIMARKMLWVYDKPRCEVHQ